MKTVLLALVLATQVFALNPAFQSIVSPSFSSPFSSYSFNVINTNNNRNPYTHTYSSPYNTNRIVYIAPTSFINTQIGISHFLSNYQGLSGVPSILRLKDFQRSIDGSRNNMRYPSINQAKTGLHRHSSPLYKDGR